MAPEPKSSKDILTPTSLAWFLENVPPGKDEVIIDAVCKKEGYGQVNPPEITLHCPTCDGERYFEPICSPIIVKNNHADAFLHYCCRNCRMFMKVYALHVDANGNVRKYGEVPGFGPPIPARVLELVGPDRELLLRGRRCESQGLGIAAFAYYRRVVENQKDRILGEITRVVKVTSPGNPVIADLEAAKGHTQFARTLEAMKHMLPDSLLINTHNPLQLLHTALSEHLHEGSDDECLALATSIRTILFRLAEKLAQAMKDQSEITEAVKHITRKKPTLPDKEAAATASRMETAAGAEDKSLNAPAATRAVPGSTANPEIP